MKALHDLAALIIVIAFLTWLFVCFVEAMARAI